MREIGTFTKKVIGDELYIFNAKGELIFKRWLKLEQSKVFNPFPYGKDTITSITDEGIKINA